MCFHVAMHIMHIHEAIAHFIQNYFLIAINDMVSTIHITIVLLPKLLHIKRVEAESNLCVQRKFELPLSEQE